MDKKLYVVSVGLREICVVAGYVNETLFIQKMKLINSRKEGLVKVQKEMATYRKRGFVVAVNEPIKRLSKNGVSHCNLADLDGNGAPKLVAAITAYQQLSRRNSLLFDKSVRRVSIPETVYEKEISDNGGISYRVDWDSISEEAIALLVTVYNSVFTSSTEINYLKSVFATLNARKKKPRLNLRNKLLGNWGDK